MALDFQLLENVRRCPGGHRAACPACRSSGGDRTGNHLFIKEDGRFGCAAFAGDEDHRRIIHALVGKLELSPTAVGRSPRRRRSSMTAGKQRRNRLEKDRLSDRIRREIPSILEEFGSEDWVADLWHGSPVRLEAPDRDWELFLDAVFPADAVVFVGDLANSGEGKGEGHFRRVDEWLEYPSLPGPRVSAATFLPGTIHRTKDRVASRPYLVIESDELIGRKPVSAAECDQNKQATAALFHWLVKVVGMHLAAVIDTGNKSLHGWFRTPQTPGFLAQFESAAPALRLDRSLLRQPNAPVRLPGAIHEKSRRAARLLYLDTMR